MPTSKGLRRRALLVEQHPRHPLYLFTMTGDELAQYASVFHAGRGEGGELLGYQRPEVARHIRSITRYIDGPEVLFPNSIILALHSSVSFERGPRVPKLEEPYGIPGFLRFPVPTATGTKPAWVVDGQQRVAAIAKSSRRSTLVVPVSAFVADEIDVQREHFIRVNSSKPLPQRLLSELLPHVDAQLSEGLDLRKVPSALCDQLNQDPASPFFGLIWRSTLSSAAKKRAVCMDTCIIQMLEDSMNRANGCLFPYRNLATGRADVASMQRLLYVYWTAVRDVWPSAWGISSRDSRLMHGAGLRAMGRVMDRVMGRVDLNARGLAKYVRGELARLRPTVRWTSGEWDELGLAWNEVQNTPTHVRKLSSYLVRSYMEVA